MSIESEIIRIAGNVADSYAAVRQKGGVLPDNQTSDNLPEAIHSIPAGIALESVSITAAPARTSYHAGEMFDPSGMVVAAAFSNGETVAVDETGITFSPSGTLSAADTQVAVSFEFGGITQTAVQPITVISAHVFGVKWDSSNSSTAMVRLTAANDPNHLVNVDIAAEPVPAVGSGAGSSPFDDYLPWKGMEEYNIIDGEVKYKRGDPAFSRSAYDTMVYIPEYWYKVVQDGNDWYFYVSDTSAGGFEKHPGSGKYVGRYKSGEGYVSKTGIESLVNITRSDARAGSTAKGDKWCQNDFASWGAVEFLFRVEFADWNSQAKIGMGIVNDTYAHKNGETDSMIYHTGRAAGENGRTAVQYRHIENLWGNLYEYLDGVNINEKNVYICLDHKKYVDGTETNYAAAGVVLPSSGWIKSIGQSAAFPWAFLPNKVGGNETTFIPDLVETNIGSDWCCVRVSNRWTKGSDAGMWYIDFYRDLITVSDRDACRLKYDPEETAGQIEEMQV